MSLKAKIEAVLFVTSKPIRAQALARIVNADVQAVRQAVLELVHDYEERKGGLEISDEDGYSFQVKEEYASLMDEFMPVEMSAALIRTLSAVAIKQPISQSEIIRIRGAGAYEHIRELVNRELLAKKEEAGGRSPILSTTKKFQDYFRLTKEGKDLRTFLKKAVRKAEAASAAANERQLVIPSVIGNEAEGQLNQGIFLETADSSYSESADIGAVGMGDGSDGGVAEMTFGGDGAVPVPPVAASDDIAISLPPVAAGDDDSASLPSVAAVEDSAAPNVVAAADDAATVPAAESIEDVVATTTLSKLKAAATVKPPKPIKEVISESSSSESGASVPEVAAPDAVVDAPPTLDQVSAPSAEPEVNAAPPTGSNVQAMTASMGPAMGTGKKSKPQPASDKADKLAELMMKQKRFEKQLKLGIFGDELVADDLLSVDISSHPSNTEKLH